MVRSIRLVQDKSPDEVDQRAERPLSQEDASKLAEIMAELTYLDHLEATRASNVASLKRLKDACDALLDSGLSTFERDAASRYVESKDEPAKQ
ncbi:hypothetical protein [Bradyrhizobium retamae]|uniref:Uncharacterized protein n=1 Tax=Bradyrhizobium retamae TaxID=1300035 RepID=A0A0R3MUF1_9BRAD|nr:hypothetical protein [Bradyrhizobium retamae]KRR20886.1 hypothetical protein CQ13_31730 [Bradyrhizobium retamae]